MSHEDQTALWQLIYSTIRPKSNESANGCLNRLAKEYFGKDHVQLSEDSAFVSRERWPVDELRSLERHHFKMHADNDLRPLVVVQRGTRKVVIDGNHRLTRWLQAAPGQYDVLLLQLRGERCDI